MLYLSILILATTSLLHTVPTPDEPTAIRVERTVNAPVEAVWRAWTTNEGAQEFFARKTNIELRIGGPYEILFLPENPPGQRGAENLEILSYLPMEMLSIQWDAPPQFSHARGERTWVVIMLEPVDASRTRVRLTHLGWDEMKAIHPDHAEEWDAVRTYFENAWPSVLRALDRRFIDGPRWDANGSPRWN